jgi:hypothetical protein
MGDASEGSTCTCADADEHTALLARISASYVLDVERARDRIARNTAALRAAVVAAVEGR